MVQRLGLGLVGWRQHSRVFLTLILLAALGPPVSQVGAASQDEGGHGPGSEHVQVIAQGVVDLSGEDSVWRIVRYSAASGAEAEFGTWPLGFVLATSAPLLLTDKDTGDQLRLGPGEAALVRDGTAQRRSSLDAATASYMAIELVPASQAESSDEGAVLQTWPADVADSGPHDIDLVRSDLVGDDPALLSGSGATNVLLVTEGLVVAGPAGGEGRTLLAGEAMTFTEDLEIRQPADEEVTDGPNSAFVAVIIGPSVPAFSASDASDTSSARPTEQAVPGANGSITIEVFNCPLGTTPETYDPDACSVATGEFDFVISSDTAVVTLTRADSVNGEGVYTWEELPLGEYRVTEVVLPPGYTTYVLTAEGDVEGGPRVGYSVTLDEGSPDAALDVYNFPPS